MEFKSYQEALAYVNGQVPGATPEQIEAAKAWLDSPEGKAAANEANSPKPLSKSEPKKSASQESMERLQKQVANNTAVQAAEKAGEKAKNAIENPTEPNEFGWKKNMQKSEDNMNKTLESGNLFAKGDELRDVLTNSPGGGAVEGQATKPGEAAMEELKEEGKLSEKTEEINPTDTKQVSETVQEAEKVAEPEKTDTVEDKQIKNKYKNQSMSIWDAYYNGEFGEPGSEEAKNTRNYFIVDAIAKFASNMGRSIGNIGAQYSGGTIDNNKDVSKWEEVRDTLGSEELQTAKEQLGGQAGRKAESELQSIESQKLANARAEIINKYTPAQIEAQTQMLYKELEMAGINIDLATSKKAVIDYIKSKPNWESNPYYIYLVSSLAQSGVGGTVQTAGNVISSVVDIFK